MTNYVFERYVKRHRYIGEHCQIERNVGLICHRGAVMRGEQPAGAVEQFWVSNHADGQMCSPVYSFKIDFERLDGGIIYILEKQSIIDVFSAHRFIFENVKFKEKFSNMDNFVEFAVLGWEACAVPPVTGIIKIELA